MGIIDKEFPPGELIKTFNNQPNASEQPISFSFASSTVPFSPLVQAKYDNKGRVRVSCVVFIASDGNGDPVSPNFTGVNLQSVISGDGTRQLDLFIMYDDEERASDKFYAYNVDFKIPVELIPKNLSQIEVFLWDVDPVTSRGTVTPVQGSGGE